MSAEMKDDTEKENTTAAAVSVTQTSPRLHLQAEEQVYISNCCRNGRTGEDVVMSKGLVRFLVTSFFTLILLGFAMYKLSSEGTTGDEKALYYSLLASCVAVYIPAPSPHDPTPARRSSVSSAGN